MAIILGAVGGLSVLLAWIWLVGPQVHVVESILGLVFGGVVWGLIWWKLRKRLNRGRIYD